MDSAEREILSLLGSVSTLFSFLVAIAVIVLGIVVVRPLNKVAGIVFAGAGGGRLFGLGLDMILDALQPKDAEDGAHGEILWILDPHTQKKPALRSTGRWGFAWLRALTAGPFGSVIPAIVVGAQRSHAPILPDRAPADKRRFRLKPTAVGAQSTSSRSSNAR